MPILVDTPVWIDHLRKDEPKLTELLGDRQVLIHPFVIGELALGNLTSADIAPFRRLPHAVSASHGELMSFLQIRSLHGSGVGYVDAHLLLAASLTPEARLWTRDRRLRQVANAMWLAATDLD